MAIQHPHSFNGAEMVHELAILKHAFETTVRERDWLRQDLTAARDREHDYREQLAWFRRRLEQAEARYDQMVQASAPQPRPRPSPRPVATAPASPRARQGHRPRILACLQAHPGPHRRKDLEAALGAKTLEYVLRHMVDDGLIVRVAPGIFQGNPPASHTVSPHAAR